MKRLLLLLLAIVLLSGCEMRAELVVKKDGSGTMTYVLGIDKASIKPGADPLAGLKANAAKAPFPVRVTDYSTDKVVGVRASFDFRSLGDLRSKLTQLNAGRGRTFVFDDLSVTKSGSGWRLAAHAGDPLLGKDAVPIDVSQANAAVDVRFVATLPGARASANATAVRSADGATTYEWRIPAGKGDLNLLARTTVSSTPWALIAGAGAGVVALLGLALVLWRRRRRTTTPEPELVPAA